MDSRSESPGLAGLRKAVGDFLDSLDETLTTDSQQLPNKVPQLIQRMNYLHFQPTPGNSSLLDQLIKKLEECKREVCKHLEDTKLKGPSRTLHMSKVLGKFESPIFNQKSKNIRGSEVAKFGFGVLAIMMLLDSYWSKIRID
ncbi:hypothetical protein chiPu_0011936 [Chiloscyllium punctatum]|uniref:Uncharacterized protein n=1 Tax=Chiloscyllium punctatum TaxID=137246 RepID=A0A401SST7_CHIPU|nr:hypothetical protein [Chiloscyllium punctatum]